MMWVRRSYNFNSRQVILGTLCVLLWAIPSGAATLHVAADGSAPYADLASAAAAAASGDTIRIAAGEYPQVADYTLDDGYAFQAVVYVEVPELTILGESRDTVILGPAVPLPNMEHAPFGINQVASTSISLVVRGVTVRNTSFGIALFTNGEATDCRLVGNFKGISSRGLVRTLVGNCEILGSQDAGVSISGEAAPNMTMVEDSQFADNLIGVDFRSSGSLLRNCTITGGRVGMQVSLGGSATVTNCTFVDNEFVGAGAPFGCGLALFDNEFLGASGTNLFNDGSITGSGNILSGGTFATLHFAPRAHFDFHNNHILNAGGYTALMPPGGTDPVIPIDLTNNHWGTEDPAQIDAWILDHNDDDRIKGEVLYAPFFPRPIPTESTSFGALKSRFQH